MEAVCDPLDDLAAAIRRDRAWIVGTTAAAACLHAWIALGVALARLAQGANYDVWPTEIVEIELPSAPAAPIEPKTSLATPEAPSRPSTTAPRTTAAPARPTQAAAVLTRQPDPNEPVDLTSTGFVIGSASTYVSGPAAPDGSSPSPSGGGGVANGPSTTAHPPTAVPTEEPDRSRRASVMGGGEWKCPFPAEADAEQIDQAMAAICVDVNSAGAVLRVTVTSDPGHGFGREAQRCAMGKRWNPALDRAGNPTEGTVTIRVRFDR